MLLELCCLLTLKVISYSQNKHTFYRNLLCLRNTKFAYITVHVIHDVTCFCYPVQKLNNFTFPWWPQHTWLYCCCFTLWLLFLRMQQSRTWSNIRWTTPSWWTPACATANTLSHNSAVLEPDNKRHAHLCSHTRIHDEMTTHLRGTNARSTSASPNYIYTAQKQMLCIAFFSNATCFIISYTFCFIKLRRLSQYIGWRNRVLPDHRAPRKGTCRRRGTGSTAALPRCSQRWECRCRGRARRWADTAVGCWTRVSSAVQSTAAQQRHLSVNYNDSIQSM